MKKVCKILTILGSPHDKTSNTRALVEDFVREMADAGLSLEHRIIPLGRKKVLPCAGCWNCTRNMPCPLAGKDDLEEIKAAMIDCDMLILASPVYANQVTAQMKAFIDRLFTWCHVFPLLGKYSLSACTTGNDGLEVTGAYLEKILATYGTFSFGNISSKGGYTPGLFFARDMAREKNRELARKAAAIIMDGGKLPVNTGQKKIFKMMKRKMTGLYTVKYIHTGPAEGRPKPPIFLQWLLKRLIRKVNMSDQDLGKWSRLLAFERGWWKDRNWLHTRSFTELASQPGPSDFNIRKRLLALGKSLKKAG
jgi:multimeric flavodoxin WrbA